MDLKATADIKEAYVGADFIIIATPTNRYDECLDNVEEKVYTRDLFRRD